MSIKTRNILFLSLTGILITLCVISVFTVRGRMSLTNPSHLSLLIMRSLGLVAYVLITLQLVLGLFQEKLIQIFGSKAYRYHIVFGTAALILIILHPLMLGISRFLNTHDFIDLFTLLPVFKSDSYTFSVNLGRTAFYLFVTSLLVALTRTKFFRKNWLKAHYLNYAAYPLIFFHARVLGVNTGNWFGLVFYPLSVIGFGVIIYRIYKTSEKFMSSNNAINKA